MKEEPMITTDLHQPVAPGQIAPSFLLPAADGNGIVSLSDYRSRSAVFLALFVGLWCPFCRRALAQLSATDAKLRAKGVETVGVVATSPENARLYGYGSGPGPSWRTNQLVLRSLSYVTSWTTSCPSNGLGAGGEV
jgi:thiol-disulfide isomerase/thioredoxin